MVRWVPCTISGSVPQIATARIRHRTSPASARGTGTSRIAKALADVNKHARIVWGIILDPSRAPPNAAACGGRQGRPNSGFSDKTYLVEKIKGIEFTHTAVAFLVPQFATR